MQPATLLAVPNVSEGRDVQTIAAIAEAFADAGGVRLLDVHSDGDHHRTVFTLSGQPGRLGDALLRGAGEAVRRVDVMAAAHDGASGHDPAPAGKHPHVGAVDVVPLVYLDAQARGAACAEALVVADRIAEELQVPVFLYGELSGADPGSPRTRAQLRRGGVAGLAARMVGEGERIAPDFGPSHMHPSAGATLVAARPPLVAFNLQLAAAASVQDAREIAATIREHDGGGLPGVRAIAVELGGGVAQVSMNVERPFQVSLAMVVDAVRPHAEVLSAELVGLAPAAALEGFPEDVPIPGFDPARHVIENALGC
jgi:glutamate formiminotransferase/glutamate formiminotransferase/formiminotetrahydrofolate cyclodeaminase